MAGGSTAGSAPANPDPAAYYQEDNLEWGKYNFDLNPPIYTDGENIQDFGGFLYVNGKARLAVWQKSGQPGKAECAAAVEADGSNQSNYEKGNRICGRTAEGRIFVLYVTATGNTLRTQVTVWNK